MSKLNKDILFLLFDELQDDSKSLFQCLLVNRLWCETSVPILWRNPWCYEDVDYQSKSSLYHIITCSLSDDIKEKLKNQGMNLPLISLKSLLFDYLSYCRSINVTVINDIISIGGFSIFNQFLLQEEIYNLFMMKCQEIKYFDMRSVKHQLFYFPEAKVRLEPLCELTCDTSVDRTYFYGLARICQSIQRLIIVNTNLESNNGIVKLIETQKNLKYFEWKDDLSNLDYYPIKDVYINTFLELSNKADTLIHLVTHFNDYSEYSYEDGHLQEIISRFYNIKTLKIYPSCYGPFDYKYQHLEVLQIGYILIDTITCIIKSSGGRLKKILINEYDIYEDKFYENTLILIRTIYENCPLVEYLSLIFSPSNQHFAEFEKLLNTCQRLKVLLLETESLSAEKRFISGEKLSHALVRSAPNSLKEIGVFYQFKFSPKTLEEFSEGWKGRPAITILAPDHDYKEEKYTKIIDKYKVGGVIKDFLCGFLIDFIFNY